MKASIVSCGVSTLLLITAAMAQDGPTRPGVGPSAVPAGGPRPAVPLATLDRNVQVVNNVAPPLTPPDQLRDPTLVPPNDPIEPWLLTKDAGPFMVMAKTFRGPEAERYALALAMELRRDHGLPAYIMRTKDFPMRSMHRGVPPYTPEAVKQSHLTEPEKVRSYDEAAVLVGNEKTLVGSEELWHRVKKIHPKCLEEVPSIFPWRKGQGLSTALRTTNPYVPAQQLYPGRLQRDEFVLKMNRGPHSIYKCPGRYSLIVADFTGRSMVAMDATKIETKSLEEKFDKMIEKTSFKGTLVTAHDDAESLVENLANAPEIKKTGFQPYVYHDRTSSKVLLGSFNSPNDPAAVQLRETLLRIAGDLSRRTRSIIIAPAASLTDLEDPNRPIKAQ